WLHLFESAGLFIYTKLVGCLVSIFWLWCQHGIYFRFVFCKPQNRQPETSGSLVWYGAINWLHPRRSGPGIDWGALRLASLLASTIVCNSGHWLRMDVIRLAGQPDTPAKVSRSQALMI